MTSQFLAFLNQYWGVLAFGGLVWIVTIAVTTPGRERSFLYQTFITVTFVCLMGFITVLGNGAFTLIEEAKAATMLMPF